MRINAFGELKNARQWSEDPRCLVPWRTLKYRVDNGWDAEAAITTPAGNKKKTPVRMFVKYRGVYYDEKKQRYKSIIRMDGRMRKLGVYTDPEEAAREYNRALLKIADPDRTKFNILEPMF